MDIRQLYVGILERIRIKILQEDDQSIIGTATDELAQYFLQDTPREILFDLERSPHMDRKKELRIVRAHQREEFYRSEGDKEWEYETITVTLYLNPETDARFVRQYAPSTYSHSWSPERVTWGKDTVSFNIDTKGYGINIDAEEIKRRIESQRNNIESWIRWVNEDITQGNATLAVRVPELIEKRKAALKEDEDKWQSLVKIVDIPLKRKENEAVKRIQVDTKPLIKKMRPKPNLPEEYELDRDKVIDIISIIDNQGRQFEKTPGTYREIGEEDLRNILLVGLNSVFEGKATGETFLSRGKTDIYLAIDKGNILICECKIWDGKALYAETINQLLSYLTWHQNYGVIITFVKQKNFSSVIAQTESIVTSHPSYRTGFFQKNKTHFISHHILPGDDMKDVEIHHIFYNLYIS